MGLNKTLLAQIIGSMGQGFYAANAVFDGNYLSRTAASLTGVSDSALGSAAVFLTSNSTIGSYRTLLAVGRCVIGIDDAGKLYGYMRDSTTTKSITFRTSAVAAAGHYALEWDTSGAAGAKVANILFNGSPISVTTTDTSVGFSVNYTGVSYVGALASGASQLYADIGELLFWPGTFANWSANISKVYAGGKAVNPGPNGVTPLGVVPAIYFSIRDSELGSAFATNRGSGGAFAANGLTIQRADEGLVSYGDSLTYGTGSSGPATAWTSLVSHGLNRPIKQVNYGIGGLGISAIADNMEVGNVGYKVPAASVAAASYKAIKWTLEGGYNSIANGSASIIASATRMRNALLAAYPAAKYVFLGIPNGTLIAEGVGTGRYDTIIAANTGLAALYGEHFLDIRQWLIDNGLAAAGLTATANDLADIANGIVPRSLRSPDGSVHWNDYGNFAVYVAVLQKMTALGYN